MALALIQEHFVFMGSVEPRNSWSDKVTDQHVAVIRGALHVFPFMNRTPAMCIKGVSSEALAGQTCKLGLTRIKKLSIHHQALSASTVPSHGDWKVEL